MKENLEDYRKDGVINLDEYFLNNPSGFTYPYYIEGYDEQNFWAKVRKEDEDRFIYVKPREQKYTDNDYNVYSELLYEELMRQVGIKCVDFDLARYDGNMATISDNILKDYSYDQFIISGQELIENKKYPVIENEYSIEDLIDSVNEYCIEEKLSDEIKDKCIQDIQKSCIADIFALSTSRKPTDFDFVVGKNGKGEDMIELAPLCHNTYCLGSNFETEEIYDMLEDDDMLADKISLCYFDAGVPENKREYDYPYWEDSLYYYIDKSEENLNFAKKCAEKMNIDKAIKDVEEKIDNSLPEEYKDFVRVAWDNRLQGICECMELDYYKIMDNKYCEQEMEEI